MNEKESERRETIGNLTQRERELSRALNYTTNERNYITQSHIRLKPYHSIHCLFHYRLTFTLNINVLLLQGKALILLAIHP